MPSCEALLRAGLPLAGGGRDAELRSLAFPSGAWERELSSFRGLPVPAAIFQHTFPNDLTLLAERMDHVRSAAVNFLVPAGCAYDPPERLGLVSILSDMITRGAG